MRAVLATSTGWRLGEVPEPTPGPQQVLVTVTAVSLNNADTLPAGPQDAVAGYEFAGVVIAAGPGATRVGVGERVMGTTPGSFAERVAVDHRHVVTVPDGLCDEEAAALPTALLTEHGALALAGFSAGDAVLITAATSGIARTGLQVVRALGGRVVATTRSGAQREAPLQAGAEVVVVTDEEDLTSAVLGATDGEGVAVVLDHVGGEVLAAAVGATRRGGVLVSIGRLSGDVAGVDLAALSSRQLMLRGVSFGFSDPDQIGDVLAALQARVLPAVADGRVRPVLGEVLDDLFDLDAAQAALGRLQQGRVRGKVVLRVTSST